MPRTSYLQPYSWRLFPNTPEFSYTPRHLLCEGENLIDDHENKREGNDLFSGSTMGVIFRLPEPLDL